MNIYDLHISLYGVAFLGTVFAGFTLALLLAFAKQVGKTGNLFLSLALIATVLKAAGLTPVFLPALGPLLYFYVRQLTSSGRPFRWKHVLHFCPVLAGSWIPAWLVLISVIIYLFLAYRLIQGFYRQLRPVLMDRPRFTFRRLEKTFVLLGLLCLLCLFNTISFFVVAFVLMGMAVPAILNPHGNIPLATPVKDRSDAREKSRRLKEAVAANRLYEDAELTLTTLALKLNIHPHELSRIINDGLKKNFSDFINEFRVKDVVRKMQDPAYNHLTLLGIAFESGFNSQATFNRTFRQMTGKSPKEYKNDFKKEHSSYDLSAFPRPAVIISGQEGLPKWSSDKLNRSIMFKNYLKIAWRNLVRNKVSSFINIGGLAVGMAVAMLIGLWIRDELSFNKYHQNYDRIVQVMQKEKVYGDINIWGHMPYRLLNELKTNYRDNFKHIVIATEADSHYLSQGENKIAQTGQYIEAAAPEMLTLKMLRGSWAALNDPHSILLSASAAKRLFGDADPFDKTIKVSDTWDVHNTTDVKVTGVYEDLPRNTEFFGTQFFMPWDLYAAADQRLRTMAWDDHHFLIYAEIKPGVDLDKASANVKDAELKVIRHLDDMKKEVAANPEIVLNPMKNWHLYSNFKDGVADKGPAEFVWIVGIIGSFVLLLACINFMNLSTARSEKRAAEVGIRKAIGSARAQLISQFFSESLLVACLAFLIALVLAVFALPVLNDLSAKQIAIPFNNGWFWLACFSFILFTGLLAGIYPALYLSSFQPVKVLKGVFRAGSVAAIPRKVLVVTQFTVSIVLVICTVIVYNQLLFAKDRPVGYSRDGLVIVPMQSIDFQGKEEVIGNELMNTGAIAGVAESESPVTDISSNNGGFTWKGMNPGTEEKFGTLTVSVGYGKTIGWQFIAGRDFSGNFGNDSSGFVINEAAAKYMGLKNPIGETIHWKSKWNHIDTDFRIIGVIKNMVMESPYSEIRPVIFRLGGNHNWIFIRINPQVSVSSALPKIAGVFKKIIPSVPFAYSFADEDYAKKFTAEEQIGNLAKFFSCLAIFISCLGLFGMAMFMAEQRTKEIGVRKVLGASVFGLWRLLSKDFVALVIISLVIAAPMAWYFMARWLQGYQYRTPISWEVFAITGIGALAVALLTVSYQSIKAALANPVKSLRSE